jgi:hypothetical protein
MYTVDTTNETHPAIGQQFAGGFYAGIIMIGEVAHALIVSPKAEGEISDQIWAPNYDDIPSAKSYNDGLLNTQAMAAAGSEIAKQVLDLKIGDQGDWYIPSLDELEVIYRNLKPTGEENWCYARSGINLHAAIPTLPYTPDSPAQTTAELFQAGGAEAFDPRWYWTSTQHVSGSDYAWGQLFLNGGQGYDSKGSKCRVRAVRRVPI